MVPRRKTFEIGNVVVSPVSVPVMYVRTTRSWSMMVLPYLVMEFDVFEFPVNSLVSLEIVLLPVVSSAWMTAINLPAILSSFCAKLHERSMPFLPIVSIGTITRLVDSQNG